MIVIDSLRNDYGDIVFKFGRLEKKGFVRLHAIAPSNCTIASHASIFTGLPPCLHGVHERERMEELRGISISPTLRNRLVNIRLSKLGYRTILISANPFVSPSFGYVGFDLYFDVCPYRQKRSIMTRDEKLFLDLLASRIESKRQRIAYLFRKLRFGLLTKLAIEKYIISKIYVNNEWPRDKGGSKILELFRYIVKNLSRKILSSFIFVNIMEVHEPYIHNDDFTRVQRELIFQDKALDYNKIKVWRQAYELQVYIESPK